MPCPATGHSIRSCSCAGSGRRFRRAPCCRQAGLATAADQAARSPPRRPEAARRRRDRARAVPRRANRPAGSPAPLFGFAFVLHAPQSTMPAPAIPASRRASATSASTSVNPATVAASACERRSGRRAALTRGRPLRLMMTARAARAPRRSQIVSVAGVAKPVPASNATSRGSSAARTRRARGQGQAAGEAVAVRQSSSRPPDQSGRRSTGVDRGCRRAGWSRRASRRTAARD